ncbi:MAG: pyruvate, phosphate dikinase [Gammaproteobacteria bacterium]
MAKELGRWTLALDGTGLPEKSLIGGKAWSVARMRALGLPVPPAFVITTRACAEYLATGALPEGLAAELAAGVQWLEDATARRFGGDSAPLLLSVRSGSMISMPGMMDTVLNLGINDVTQRALAHETGDTAFAHDTRRRFVDLYARIVLRGTLPELAPDAPIDAWQSAVRDATGTEVPADPHAQLHGAVSAVFESWNSRRARRYREHHGIPHELGTAVTVQAMVFGNLDAQSGTGVLFSRNPLTGDPAPYGEYLARAQGEDVVSGRYTPEPLAALERTSPALHAELLEAAVVLERENGDVQDIEFTIQQGRLYLLQSRAAKRAPAAAVRFAVDMVREGAIDEATALSRVTAEQVRVLLSPRLAAGTADGAEVLAQGEAACQGVGVGTVVTHTDDAERRAQAGEAVVLARDTTSPDDVHGMIVAKAVITEQGGATSHAAVVSRALGVPCVVGCGAGLLAALAGRTVTVDGATGRVYAGALDVVAPDEAREPGLAELAEWAARAAPLTVYTETSPEAADARDLDHTRGGEDPAQLAALAAGATVLKGAVLNSDEGVRAAVAAGVRGIVVRRRLPALLAALTAAS